jgi:hypothetical protein
VCSQEKDSYLLYKKKNFLNHRQKTQEEVIENIYMKIKHRMEERKESNGKGKEIKLNKPKDKEQLN